MKKSKKTLPAPFAALTRDARFAGTYEVVVPVEGRSDPIEFRCNSRRSKAPNPGFTVPKPRMPSARSSRTNGNRLLHPSPKPKEA
jgi:hypothetical protein